MTCGQSRFPDPARSPRDAPAAIGGDLSVGALLDAYAHGLFPWPTGEAALTWWSPDPRAVIPLDGLHVSRSLGRTLRKRVFETSVDAAFEAVVDGCADRPATWITPEMARAYTRLHRSGHAHSVEVWDGQGRLVGGCYGVRIGAAFSAESMFHRATDASKVALVALVDHLCQTDGRLLDAQLPTPHLARLGARSVPRRQFLARLADCVRPIDSRGPPWA